MYDKHKDVDDEDIQLEPEDDVTQEDEEDNNTDNMLSNVNSAIFELDTKEDTLLEL